MNKPPFSADEITELTVGLNQLARNLWWTWNQDAQEVFQQLSPRGWQNLYHNAVAVLKEVSDYELHGAHLPGKIPVLQTHAQLVIRDFFEHGDGIVIEILPTAGGKLLESLLRVLVPGPPEIPDQLIQPDGQFRDLAGGKRRLAHNSMKNHPAVPATIRRR